MDQYPRGDRVRPKLDIGVFGARGVPSTYGGYETFLTTLLPELVNRGHSVTAYCREGAVDGDGPYRGVERVVVPGVETKQLSTLTHGAAAARLARRAGHDVLLVVNPANAPFCLWNLRAGQSVLLNTDGQEWLRGKWGWAGRAWFKTAAHLSRRCTTGLIADGTAMADVYRDQFGARSTVIPYCSPIDGFHPDPGVLGDYDLEPGGYFVIAARLNPENNVDAVAQAYHHSNLPLPLLVLGEANYDSPVSRRLRQLSADDARIRLAGHVDDRHGFLTLLSQARAYIHGHSIGGTNPSLIEAMRAGALVVALDTAFNRETLGTSGLYFPGGMGFVGDVGSVLDGVLTMGAIESRQLRDRAREGVDERYSIDAVVSAYEAALGACVDHPGRGFAMPTMWAAPEDFAESEPVAAHR